MSRTGTAETAQVTPVIATGSAMRAFGAILVVRLPVRHAGDGRSAAVRPDAVALHLPAEWRARDAMLCDLALGGPVAAEATDDGLVLLLPRRLVAALVPGRITGLVVPRSAALDALAQLADALFRADAAFSTRQARLAGSAMAELLAAALLPIGASGVGARREASLLDRVVELVDGQLGNPLDAAALCGVLNCSRSALYRAVAPAGGVAALVTQRRLSAVRARLAAPGERRSIAALARAHGFGDVSSFTRSFRSVYGASPGELRRGQGEHRRTEQG